MLIDAEAAAAELNVGRNLIFPTETVYGLGASIEFPEAVARIFELKERPLEDPLIIHLNPKTHNLFDYAYPPKASWPKTNWFEKLLAEFCPGPISFVLPRKPNVPAIVTAGHDTVALRFPQHAEALEMLALVRHPVAAPSANLFGKTSPTRLKHLPDYSGINVLKGTEPTVGLESTILDCSKEIPELLRMGGISQELIEDLLGFKVEDKTRTSKLIAPGLLENHYAPTNKQLFIFKGEEGDLEEHSDLGVLSLNTLSQCGSLQEAAANLYDRMHELDRRTDITKIIAVLLPDHGLGKAINDKLIRASTGEIEYGGGKLLWSSRAK